MPKAPLSGDSRRSPVLKNAAPDGSAIRPRRIAASERKSAMR